MTIRELYNWAIEHRAQDLQLVIDYGSKEHDWVVEANELTVDDYARESELTIHMEIDISDFNEDDDDEPIYQDSIALDKFVYHYSTNECEECLKDFLDNFKDFLVTYYADNLEVADEDEIESYVADAFDWEAVRCILGDEKHDEWVTSIMTACFDCM